jgi:hypothetical protein
VTGREHEQEPDVTITLPYEEALRLSRILQARPRGNGVMIRAVENALRRAENVAARLVPGG